jgi:hypothetical protein
VLRKYLAEVRVTRPYFDGGPDSPDELLAAEIAQHPVFRLTPVSSQPPPGTAPRPP